MGKGCLKVLIYTVVIYCIIQVLIIKKHKNPTDKDYIIPETELPYDPWERDRKGPLPKPIKPDTTPYKGKWIDIQ
jgi:hypothetical protein